jgi:hypothetical protein
LHGLPGQYGGRVRQNNDPFGILRPVGSDVPEALFPQLKPAAEAARASIPSHDRDL